MVIVTITAMSVVNDFTENVPECTNIHYESWQSE